ncbi:MAG: beta-galactosidase [Acetobacter persici]
MTDMTRKATVLSAASTATSRRFLRHVKRYARHFVRQFMHQSAYRAGLALSLFAGASSLALAAQPPSQPAAQNLLLGAAWYPEQWPEEVWEHDLALMEAAHIHLVRIGEFAWSRMEPREGDWQWGWLDHAIALAARHHMKVLLGTPSAAPPAWLTQAYPDTLRVSNAGVRDEHGNRQQFSFISARYRALTHDLAERMAIRYGHNPTVVGWQIDNELAEPSFDPEAHKAFHAWLEKKYGTIQNLNQKWWTSYWSQTYSDFGQIPVHDADENPALLLNWKQFVTETWVSYVRNQADPIRQHALPSQFITTNTMGWFDGFDGYTLHQSLDLVGWDDYETEWTDNAARHDLARGYKMKNFWVTETDPGFVNWRPNNLAHDKGEVRALAWQAVGHGADAVEYWQWRAALNGQEQYHGVIAGADGNPAPIYAEIQQIGAEFEKAAPALRETTPHAQVALLHDMPSRWAISFQKQVEGFDPVKALTAFYGPLRHMAGTVDVISPHQNLAPYTLIVAPGLNVLPQKVAEHLLAWVRQGGHLVLGPRSGMKDADNALDPHLQPGPLAAALGAHVSQFYGLVQPVPLSLGQAQGSADGTVHGTGTRWAETLVPTDPATRKEGTYGPSNGWLDGAPVAVSHQVGKGEITYLSTIPDPATLETYLKTQVQSAHALSPFASLPADVEACVRRGQGHDVLVLINHARTPVTFTLPESTAAADLLTPGAPISGPVTLPGYGVRVLRLARSPA